MLGLEMHRAQTHKPIKEFWPAAVGTTRKNRRLIHPNQILAVPTPVRKLPEPVRKTIGDLSNTEQVLVGLDLRSHTAL